MRPCVIRDPWRLAAAFVVALLPSDAVGLEVGPGAGGDGDAQRLFDALHGGGRLVLDGGGQAVSIDVVARVDAEGADGEMVSLLPSDRATTLRAVLTPATATIGHYPSDGAVMVKIILPIERAAPPPGPANATGGARSGDPVPPGVCLADARVTQARDAYAVVRWACRASYP